jgi:hypothetical protein
MRDWHDRKLVETVHRVRGVVKSFEKAPYPGEFQNRRCRRRDGRKLDVAIPLHGLFEDTQQDVDSRAIELPQFGTVEHNSRAIGLQVRLDFAKKTPALLNAQLLRQLFHRHMSCTGHNRELDSGARAPTNFCFGLVTKNDLIQQIQPYLTI